MDRKIELWVKAQIISLEIFRSGIILLHTNPLVSVGDNETIVQIMNYFIQAVGSGCLL